ncbi:MAG: DUF480 domain-containing protein [Trueperaceae bacterium]
MALSDIELRVLGALTEKERVTPDSYPLTTQSLVTACNQKTSRDPVTDYHLQEINEALQKLRDKGLVGTRQEVTDRVPKHNHRLYNAFDVNVDELGLLSVLMLRGAQTAGELRTRTDRYRLTLRSLPDYEACLRALSERNVPLVQNVGRAPGQSQDRWQHTLGFDEDRLQPRVRRPEGGAVASSAAAPAASTVASTGASGATGGGSSGAGVDVADLLRRLEELEERVAALEEELGG